MIGEIFSKLKMNFKEIALRYALIKQNHFEVEEENGL